MHQLYVQDTTGKEKLQKAKTGIWRYLPMQHVCVWQYDVQGTAGEERWQKHVTRTTRGQQTKLHVPYSRTNVLLHSFFPLRSTSLELLSRLQHQPQPLSLTQPSSSRTTWETGSGTKAYNKLFFFFHPAFYPAPFNSELSVYYMRNQIS